MRAACARHSLEAKVSDAYTLSMLKKLGSLAGLTAAAICVAVWGAQALVLTASQMSPASVVRIFPLPRLLHH